MNRSYKKLFTLLLCSLLMGLPSSCVYEDEVPCPCEVRFVYDYNMEFADAFPAQVNDVTLFIFDAEGRYLTSQQDSGDHLDGDYRMSLNLQPGTYRLVAWAGLAGHTDSYNLNASLTPGVSTLDELTLKLNRTDASSPYYDSYLPDLWHGMLADFQVSADSPSRGVISLVKDVNRFRVLLQTTDGQPLDKDDYTFSIQADNHSLNYDNALLPCTPLTYRAYTMQEAVIENQEAEGDISVLVGELATLRLMADKTPRFVIRNKAEGKDLFNIDLVRYLNLMKLDEYADMPLQEYLDRENTWQVILVVGKAPSTGAGVVLSIQINNWRMIFNHTNL